MFPTRYCLLVLAFLGGCGTSPEGVRLPVVGEAYGRAYCNRVFTCCTEAEIAARYGGAGLVFSDEPSCVTRLGGAFANEFVYDVTNAEASSRGRYHPDRMAACLERLRNLSCAEFSTTSVLPRCIPAPVEGLVPDGGSCDHDFQCISDYCQGGNHAGTAGTCRAPPGPGELCPDPTCADGLYCDGSEQPLICKPLLPDGAGCVCDLECTSRSCNGVDATGGGTCGSPTVCAGVPMPPARAGGVSAL